MCVLSGIVRVSRVTGQLVVDELREGVGGRARAGLKPGRVPYRAVRTEGLTRLVPIYRVIRIR